jgi:hypothetical protein
VRAYSVAMLMFHMLPSCRRAFAAGTTQRKTRAGGKSCQSTRIT